MIDFLSMYFSKIWELFSTIKYPGIDIPISKVYIGAILMVFSIRIIGKFLGFQAGEVKYEYTRALRKDRHKSERKTTGNSYRVPSNTNQETIDWMYAHSRRR